VIGLRLCKEEWQRRHTKVKDARQLNYGSRTNSNILARQCFAVMSGILPVMGNPSTSHGLVKGLGIVVLPAKTGHLT
jgi:hypothetical protein